MHHPGLTESPIDAAVGEGFRTAGEAAKGFLESPLDMAKGAYNTVRHPLDTMLGIARTVAHPIDAVKALGDDPRAAGSLLGQMLLAPKIPGAADTALSEGPGVVGRGIGAVGRASEAAGDAVLDRPTMGGMAALGTAVSGHPLAAAAEIGVPLAAKYGGRGLQKLGASLEGLKLATAPAMADVPDSTLSGVTLSPDAVGRNIDATNMRDMEGFSHSQAGKLAGIPGAGESTAVDVPMGEHAITQEMIDAVKDKNFPGWDAPESVDPNWHGGSGDPMMAGSEPVNPRQEMPPSMQGLQDAVAPVDPLRAARDEAVRKYLNKSPNSALSQLAR